MSEVTGQQCNFKLKEHEPKDRGHDVVALVFEPSVSSVDKAKFPYRHGVVDTLTLWS